MYEFGACMHVCVCVCVCKPYLWVGVRGQEGEECDQGVHEDVTLLLIFLFLKPSKA